MAFLSTHTTSAFLEGQVREIGIGIVIGVVLIFTELMVLGTGDVDHVKARHLGVPHQLEEGLVALPVVHPREGLPGVLAGSLVVLSQLLLFRRVEDEVEAVRVVLDLKKTQDLCQLCGHIRAAKLF